MQATAEDIIALGPCPPLEEMGKADIANEAHVLNACVELVHEEWDWLPFAQRYMLVKPTKGPYVPFQANYLQRQVRYDRVIRKVLRTKRTKARRAGSTTSPCVAATVYTLTTPNHNVVVAAKDIPSAKRIAIDEQIKPLIDHTHPIALGLVKDVNLVERELRITHAHKMGMSKIWVAGFKDESAGVGFDCHYGVITEAAKLTDPDWKKWDDLEQAIPDTGFIEIESVAEGIGNGFYRLYSSDKWLRQFFPWWTRETAFLLPGPENEKISLPESLWGDFRLTPEESALQEKFGVTLDQFRFYRWRLLEDGPDLTKQFYPSNWREAFISTTLVTFPQQRLEMMLHSATAPMDDTALPADVREKAVHCGWRSYLSDKADGLRIFRLPEKGHTYSIGVDSSYGELDGDYSCSQVIDDFTGEQVACLRGHYRVDHLADYTYKLARWYNDAFVIPEQNAVGQAVCALLEGMYAYGEHVFKHEDKEHAGFYMTKGRKEELFGNLSKALEAMMTKINDVVTIDQALSFQKGKGGKLGAPEGQNDDAVMAYMLAYLRRSEGRTGPALPRRKPLVYAAA